MVRDIKKIKELKKEEIYTELKQLKENFNRQTGIHEYRMKCELSLEILDGAQLYKLNLISREKTCNVIRLIYTDHYHLFLLDNKVSYNMMMVSKKNICKEIDRFFNKKENKNGLYGILHTM
jgi:hypothetical protein